MIATATRSWARLVRVVGPAPSAAGRRDNNHVEVAGLHSGLPISLQSFVGEVASLPPDETADILDLQTNTRARAHLAKLVRNRRLWLFA